MLQIKTIEVYEPIIGGKLVGWLSWVMGHHGRLVQVFIPCGD